MVLNASPSSPKLSRSRSPMSSSDARSYHTETLRLGDREVSFKKRLLYKVRAGTLREFLATNRGQYVIIDPFQEALLIYDDGLEKIGPMRFGLHGPVGSKRLSKLFSIQHALFDYLDTNNAHIKIPEPSYTVIQEWKARLATLFSEVRVLRWGKGGRIRETRHFKNWLGGMSLGDSSTETASEVVQ